MRRVGKVRGGADTAALSGIRRRSVDDAKHTRSDSAPDLIFCVNVLCDLVSQGWQLKTRKSRLYAKPPSTIDLDQMEEKARVRRAHLVERDAQLGQASVRAFVSEMERRRLWSGEWHSIFSLMRDGSELAEELSAAGRVTGAERISALERVIEHTNSQPSQGRNAGSPA